LYRHLTAAGSWEWYDHGHDGTPRVCKIQLHCTDTTQYNYMYRHLTAAGSWEWYDHGHNGTPRGCRIQLHCTDTLQLQVLGSGTITTTMAPSCLYNTTTLYRHLTAAGSWERYDHGHDGTNRVFRIQLHCTDTLRLQVLRSGMITATTAPLVFVEYNYIVPTPYSCWFLGVVRSRPRRHPSCL
jgi:hypothetical protein